MIRLIQLIRLRFRIWVMIAQAENIMEWQHSNAARLKYLEAELGRAILRLNTLQSPNTLLQEAMRRAK